MSIYGKQISLGPGAGDHPIYHHRNLLFFRGKPSSPSFFINQPMGIWDMTISFGNFNGSDAKLDVQENPLVESWKGFFPTCQVRVVRFYVSWSALLRTSGSKCSPPDLKHKEFLKIYQVECQVECQKICQTNVTW